MDVIAPPVAVLPKLVGKGAAAHTADSHAAGAHAATASANAASSTDASATENAATTQTGDAFGDLLAKQLSAGLAELPPPVEVDAQLESKQDATIDKVTPDSAELAAQLQATIAAQLQASGTVAAAQALTVTAPAAAVIDETATQQVGEVLGQQRQVIAAVAPELAAPKRNISAGEGKVEAEKNQDGIEKNQVELGRSQQSAFATKLASAEQSASRELGAVQHAMAEKKQSVFATATPEAQPATAVAVSQVLPSQSNQSAQANSATPSTSIQAPVGSSAWGNSLGDKVVWMVGQQHQGVELHLNPPALGPLEVRVSISDGQANLSFMTQHAPVREAIEGATSRLREMLGDSGISMGSVSVNVGSFAQQQPPTQQENGRSSQTFRQFGNDTDFFSNAPVVAIRPLHGNGMVDTFA